MDLEALATGALGAAVVSGAIRIGTELIRKRRDKPAVDRDIAEAARAISDAFTPLVDNLQEERKHLRHVILGQTMTIQAHEQKAEVHAAEMRKASEAAHRADQFMGVIETHLTQLNSLIEQAGGKAPVSPDVDAERRELRAAIPDLMRGGIAGFGARMREQ